MASQPAVAPALDAVAVHRALRALAGDEATALRCAVAWSGGLDSTVLLHALRTRSAQGPRIRLRALHVDHGLQAAAAGFRTFCQRTARRWRLPLTVLRVRVDRSPGVSVEQAARDARRQALAAALAPGELLLTAQHADDQLETVLLALLRGAGPKGLAGMPAAMPLAGTRLLRPLLQFDRAAIAAYAAAAGLDWVEDPTNADVRFDRNYLRKSVLPALRQRWPAASRTALRSARHCASAALMLESLAARDLEAAADGAGLEIAVLRRFSAARRAAVLRAWLQRAGCRAPNERHLREIEAMMAARRDAHPQLRLPDGVLRRSGGRLTVHLNPLAGRHPKG
ncbi:MAG TPA: tRNA lysidine(34) synthetase TilS [Steroidobacteraceae bacterium]|nr:tRNA lysidine(34) synthetase TilS [Steroidobacteraceae bacterium]